MDDIRGRIESEDLTERLTMDRLHFEQTLETLQNEHRRRTESADREVALLYETIVNIEQNANAAKDNFKSEKLVLEETVSELTAGGENLKNTVLAQNSEIERKNGEIERLAERSARPVPQRECRICQEDVSIYTQFYL